MLITDKKADSGIQETVKKVFLKYLEGEGMNKTPERFSILKEIYSASGHFDAESLYEHLQKKKYKISRATVYNTLEHLLSANLIKRHQFGKNLALFEKSYAYRQHDHLICTDCNSILEFCDPRIQQTQTMIGELLSFNITHHSLLLYGKCRKLADEGKCSNFKI